MRPILIFITILSIFAAQAQAANEVQIIKIIERQKKSFQEQSWDAFFGYQLVTNKFLKRSKLCSARLSSLEIVALAKQCQFDLARVRYQDTLSRIASKECQLIGDIQELKDSGGYITLSQAFHELAKSQEDAGRPNPIFAKDIYWKLSDGAKNQLLEEIVTELENNPDEDSSKALLLRLKVPNQC